MSSLIVVTQRPVLAVVRGQDAERVGVVQAGRVVEPVVDDDARDGLYLAQIHLPPRIRIPARVEGVLAILDAVDGARRVALRGQRFDERLQPVLFDQLSLPAAGHYLYAWLRGVDRKFHGRHGENHASAQHMAKKTGQPCGSASGDTSRVVHRGGFVTVPASCHSDVMGRIQWNGASPSSAGDQRNGLPGVPFPATRRGSILATSVRPAYTDPHMPRRHLDR